MLEKWSCRSRTSAFENLSKAFRRVCSPHALRGFMVPLEELLHVGRSGLNVFFFLLAPTVVATVSLEDESVSITMLSLPRGRVSNRKGRI